MSRLGTGAGRVTARVQGADVRLRHHTTLDAGDGEVLARKAVIFAAAHVEQPHVLRADLPGHFRAVIDPLRRGVGAETDAPAEEWDHLVVGTAAAVVVVAEIVAGEIEERGTVEKEVALLGEEQRVAREIGLPLIDFGLRKIGVDGQVGPQPRGRVVEEIDAGARIALHGLTAATGRGLRYERPIGLDVETVPLSYLPDAADEPGVRHPLEPLVPRPATPDTVFVFSLDRALEVDAPGVAVRVEVEGPERKCDF